MECESEEVREKILGLTFSKLSVREGTTRFVKSPEVLGDVSVTVDFSTIGADVDDEAS